MDATSPTQRSARESVSSEPSSEPSNERYSRQTLFAGIGIEGQRKLAAGHIAIVGCGATGAAVASLLARAGVGTLTLIDRDFVEWSNLQRQVLFDEEDAAQSLPKAFAAQRKIARFNRHINIQAQVEDLTPGNIHTLLQPANLILDATDNYETRYLLNDYSVEQTKAWIYAGAVGAYAVTMNILPGETACLACLFPKAPTGTVETCDTAGILNPAVNFAASLEAAEAMKFLVGARDQMRRTLLAYDIWSNERSELDAAHPHPGCAVCGEKKFVHLAGEERPHITLCGRNSVQIHEHHRPVDFAEMEKRLHPHGTVRHNEMLLRFERGEYCMTLFKDGRALIQGTTDVGVARSLYARFIGS